MNGAFEFLLSRVYYAQLGLGLLQARQVALLETFEQDREIHTEGRIWRHGTVKDAF
jgi:hypothetical protein